MIPYKIILSCLTIFFHGFAEEHELNRLFASQVIGKYELFQTAVIKNNEVFFFEYDIEKNKFAFFVPKNECYILHNGFHFCTENGKIIKILQDNFHIQNDDFFNDTIDNNIFKFDVIKTFYLTKTKLEITTYNLIIPNRPQKATINIIKVPTTINGQLVNKYLAFNQTDTEMIECSANGFYRTLSIQEKQDSFFKALMNNKIQNVTYEKNTSEELLFEVRDNNVILNTTNKNNSINYDLNIEKKRLSAEFGHNVDSIIQKIYNK